MNKVPNELKQNHRVGMTPFLSKSDRASNLTLRGQIGQCMTAASGTIRI
jgi:hypothetical protein